MLYEKQFGFRHDHSTIHALLELSEKIRLANDNEKYSYGVFLDLKKAFDTVNHNIVLKKLEIYGIRGITSKWLKSFLKDRKQHATIQGIKSDQNSTDYSVPQGSVLVLLLFIIFINDFHSAIQFIAVQHFADNTNLLSDYSFKKLSKHINSDLKLVNEWIRANKLLQNASKTEIIIFKPKNKNISKCLNFQIRGQKIKLNKQVKYLRVILQNDLHWNSHLTNLEKNWAVP